jgi:hypothetical protein
MKPAAPVLIPAEGPQPRPGRFLTVALSAIAGIWSFGLPGDLWLDEIWTVNFASTLRNPFEILTTPSYDNNHPLATFVAWLLGPRCPEIAYRLVPFIAGLATVGLMAVAGRRYGERVSRIATILGGGCFFLFCYSVEARGYAPAAFASLLLFVSIAGYLDRGSKRSLFLYWLSVPLGLLAHASHVYSIAGGLCWSIVVSVRRGIPVGGELRRTLGIPAFFLLLYIPWLLTRANGGGPVYSVRRILYDVAVFATGMPDRFPANAIALLLLLLATGVGWLRMAREKRSDQAFFATTAFAAPALMTIVAYVLGDRPLYARYYLAAVPFLLILLAKAIDDGAARFARFGRYGIVVLLSLFLAGNGLLYVRFLEDRRGGYRKAVRFMTSRTSGSTITLGGKNDFPIRLVLEYYFPGGFADGKHLSYVPDVLNQPMAPEWLVSDYSLHMKDPIGGDRLPAAPGIVLPRGVAYRFESTFPAGGPSGDTWNVYRRCESGESFPDFPVIDSTRKFSESVP